MRSLAAVVAAVALCAGLGAPAPAQIEKNSPLTPARPDVPGTGPTASPAPSITPVPMPTPLDARSPSPRPSAPKPSPTPHASTPHHRNG